MPPIKNNATIMELELLERLKEALKKERKEYKEARHLLEKQNIDLHQLIDKISLDNKELILTNKKLLLQNKKNEKQATKIALAKKELAFQKEIVAYRLKMKHKAIDLLQLDNTSKAAILGITHSKAESSFFIIQINQSPKL